MDEALPYPFDPSTDVSNNAIDFGFADGLTTGQAVTYTCTGTPLANLTSGQTYYVIVVNTTTATIQLAASYANATAATPVAIAISGAGATGTSTIQPQTPIEFGFAPGFKNGDKLLYTAAPGELVDGLTSGDPYYAELDPNNPDTLLLADSPGGTPLVLSLSPVLTSPDGSQTYTITSVDAGSNSFLFDPTLGYSFTAGEPLVYQGALGTTIPGLSSGTTYYAVVDGNNPYVIQLASSPSEAMAASAYDTQLDLSETMASTLTNGSTVGTILYLGPQGTNQIVFADPAPNFSSGEEVTFNQAAGNAIDGLTNGKNYYVILVAGDPNEIELASTPGGSAIPLDPDSWLAGQTAGDTQTLDLLSIDAATGTLNLVTAPGSTIKTGDEFIYHAGVVDELVAGLDRRVPGRSPGSACPWRRRSREGRGSGYRPPSGRPATSGPAGSPTRPVSRPLDLVRVTATKIT